MKIASINYNYNIPINEISSFMTIFTLIYSYLKTELTINFSIAKQLIEKYYIRDTTILPFIGNSMLLFIIINLIMIVNVSRIIVSALFLIIYSIFKITINKIYNNISIIISDYEDLIKSHVSNIMMDIFDNISINKNDNTLIDNTLIDNVEVEEEDVDVDEDEDEDEDVEEDVEEDVDEDVDEDDTSPTRPHTPELYAHKPYGGKYPYRLADIYNKSLTNPIGEIEPRNEEIEQLHEETNDNNWLYPTPQ